MPARSSKNASAAQFTLEQLLQATPDSASIRHMMAMAAAGAGDEARAKEELQRAVDLDENYVPSRITLARLALANNAMDVFEQQLKKLLALAPEQPDVLLLQAASEHASGNTSKALALAEQAFKLAQSTSTLITLGSYQEATGDREGAVKRYESWLEEHPDDSSARMALANSLQHAQRWDDAGAQYSLVLEAAPDSVIALNNQAWILREKNPVQALEYARKASALAPDSADVLDTLAMVEFGNKDYPRARRSIERALKLAPDHPSMLYHSAMIAAAMEDTAAAKATLEQLLAQSPEFPESAEARALLTKITR